MGTPITITIPHQLGKDAARQRIAGGFNQMLQGQLAGAQIEQRWDADRLNFSARAMGQTVVGLIDVGERDVRVELDIPGLLGAFAAKIAGKLRQQGALLLEKK